MSPSPPPLSKYAEVLTTSVLAMKPKLFCVH